MKKTRNKSEGFSIIEMMITSVLVLGLSAVSYKVLKSQTSQQLVSGENQKSDSISQSAMAKFTIDAHMIDPNWIRFGVAGIYPGQGYGAGQNYYMLSSAEQSEISTISDSITFLRRDPKADRFYVSVGSASKICHPSASSSSEQQLYDQDIVLDSVEGLSVGNWILVYQAGHYALGVITHINTNQSSVATSTTSNISSTATIQGGTNDGSTSDRYISVSGQNNNSNSSMVTVSNGSIKIRKPNEVESQTTGFNTDHLSTGFVIKPGVVAADFDVEGNQTESLDDDKFCFDTSKANFQKIASPVSYFVDYQTTDGLAKSTTNAYILEKKRGERIKMLVRSEYAGGTEKREYIAPIEDVGFTYDLMDKSQAGTNNIARDVGRTKNSSFLQNLNQTSAATATSSFITEHQIVSVKMTLGFETKNPDNLEKDWKQTREIKIALDPSSNQESYRGKVNVVSSLTRDLNTLDRINSVQGSVGNEQIGKPLYLNYENESGDAGNEVVVPISTVQVMNDGSMGSLSKGALYVYDSLGCAVNPTGNCNPSNRSAITFTLGTHQNFFPNSISQIYLGNGRRKIIVGGIAMSNTNGPNGIEIKRVPGVGVINLEQGETLTEKMLVSSGTSTCSISNCNWLPINNSGNQDLVDTANIAIDPDDADKIYVASMTKQTGESSPAKIYMGDFHNNVPVFSPFATVDGAEEGKLISAISDRLIKVGKESYLAVCLTKEMRSSCPNGECLLDDPLPETLGELSASDPMTDQNGGSSSSSSSNTTTPDDPLKPLGEIQLVKLGSGGNDPGITLLRHNYRCSAMNVSKNGDLIVAGRLTVQPIPYQAIKNAVESRERGPGAEKKRLDLTPIMYLDESVAVDNGNVIYADYYHVDPDTYANPSAGTQYIGWLTGMSTVEFPDGTFAMVNGNKFRLAPNYGGNNTSSPKELSNTGIGKVELAGMNDRVVATIQIDPSNLNNSMVTATYSSRVTELPSVYIPGNFMIDSNNVRDTPTPLPSIDPSMSDASWFQLYNSMMRPTDATGLNSDMPMIGSSYVVASDCNHTRPKTCQ